MSLDYHQLDVETFATLSRRAGRRVQLLATFGLAALAAPGLLATFFPDAIRALTGLGPVGLAYWWPRGLSAYAVVLAAGLVFAMHRTVSDPRLRCPGCRKPLVPMRGVLLATGKCGRCGTRVLAGAEPDATAATTPAAPPAVPTATPLLTQTAFGEVAPRIQNKAQWVTIGTLFGGLLVLLLAINLLGEEVRATTRASVAARNVLGVGMLTALAAVIGVPMWLMTRITNDPRVRCPSCHKSMLRHQVATIATGKCGHCGAQALAPDEHAPV
jgi:hypothetical protein